MDFSKYIKFFNYGYFLSKHEPKIFKSFFDASKEVPEIKDPLEAGKTQYKREQVISKLKSYSSQTQKDRGIDKGIEPEQF